MNRIQNTIENDGIKKITIQPIAQGSVFDAMFARYEKVTIFNNGTEKTDYVDRMPTESEIGKFGFFYNGRKGGKFEWVFDGKIREEKSIKSEVLF